MNQNKIFDFVFIGLGASNSLILITLIKRGLLLNKRVAVFEVNSKTNNDKTYCFWAKPNEAIVSDLESIISHKFKKIKIDGERVADIDACPYHYIRSIDLYDMTVKLLLEEKIPIYREAVEDLMVDNQVYSLRTATQEHQATYIFDSRPPSFDSKNTNEVVLIQSFYGMHISCEKDVFQEDTFEMMNFNIEQQGSTQFMYVIPFSSKEALVELTRFGAGKIQFDQAQNLLNNYISHNFGSYEQLGSEAGCIPMTT
jgi:lycopene beta-cyclase